MEPRMKNKGNRPARKKYIRGRALILSPTYVTPQNMSHTMKEPNKTEPEIAVQTGGGIKTWADVLTKHGDSIIQGFRFAPGAFPSLEESVGGLGMSFQLEESFDQGRPEFRVLRVQGYYAPTSRRLLFRSLILGEGPDQPWNLINTSHPQIGNWLLVRAGLFTWPDLQEILERAHALAEMVMGIGSVEARAIRRWLETAKKRKGK